MLFPGELRPSITGQDPADFSHTPDPTAGPTPSFGTTTPLPVPESGAGRAGFVSVGNRKVKVKLKPGQPPPPPTPDRGTLIATPAQLGTAALRPKTRLLRRGFVLGVRDASQLNLSFGAAWGSGLPKLATPEVE